jgi:hypothetical protein
MVAVTSHRHQRSQGGGRVGVTHISIGVCRPGAPDSRSVCPACYALGRALEGGIGGVEVVDIVAIVRAPAITHILLTYTGPPGSGSRDGARPSTVVFWLTPLFVVCPRIVYTDSNGFRLLATFGECQVMGQPVAKGLLVSPSITGDFRGCYLLLAGGNHASATLNHQKWPRARFHLQNTPTR